MNFSDAYAFCKENPNGWLKITYKRGVFGAQETIGKARIQSVKDGEYSLYTQGGWDHRTRDVWNLKINMFVDATPDEWIKPQQKPDLSNT
jgi:hypothetical protein